MSKKQLAKKNRTVIQRLRSEVGMTLMEVSISLLITGVGLLSLAQLFGVAASLNTNSRTNIMVARAAQEILETNKSLSYSSLTAGTSTTTYKDIYTVTTVIQDVGLDLKKITVTVEQKAGTVLTSAKKSSVFVSYRSDPDATQGTLYNKSTTVAQSTGSNSGGGDGSSPTPTASPSVTPTPTPTELPACTSGQRPSSGCTCVAPMTVANNGKCMASATPTPTPTPSATPTPSTTPTPTPTPNVCSSGQRPSTTGCTCVAPMYVHNNGKCQ